MTKLRPLILSSVVFFLVLGVAGSIIYFSEQHRGEQQRKTLREIGTAQARLLERQLDRSLSSTFALASILRQNGKIDNFDALAAEIIKSYGGFQWSGHADIPFGRQ